jgi:hypothetical protein
MKVEDGRKEEMTGLLIFLITLYNGDTHNARTLILTNTYGKHL